MAVHQTWLDRAIGFVSPPMALQRQRARIASMLLARHYEGASTGRRTQAWRRAATDANAAAGGMTLARLRDAARDLIRNNGYAESAAETIATHTVGDGIRAAAKHDAWRRWSESTDCDADGQNDLVGLQELIMRAVVSDGEVLVRRRPRRIEDGLALPMQLQVIEADYLDTGKDTRLSNGHRVIQGVEYNGFGRRVAYWVFREHPGALLTSAGTLMSGSVSVPAREILHIYRKRRPGQVRGTSWYAPVLLTFKDFDELADATLMKQKVAACLSVITTDVDGDGVRLGAEPTDANGHSTGDSATDAQLDVIGPGMVLNAPTGRDVTVIDPPSVTDYPAFSKVNLRAIGAGLGVPYEDLTGDYAGMPFSAARMSRLRHVVRVRRWQWQILVLQFLQPTWRWAMEAAELAGEQGQTKTEWTAPPLPMVNPAEEVLADIRAVRAGQKTMSEVIRERGYNADEFFAEYLADMKRLDELGLVLDVDPRKVNQNGQLQGDGRGAG
ncbi:MAG: phage portal protein [Vicinamibacterales bacterium]|nr:phage portal protein [Vicinamibacterales bacterium]